jgi:hypothetical protein
MKHILFSLLSVGLLGLPATTNGQSIVAGQTSGAAYTDITPDRVTTIAVATGQLSDSLDLNLDGTYDVRWTSRTLQATTQLGRTAWDAHALIRPLHDNIEIACQQSIPSSTSYNHGFILGFGAATVIDAQIPQLSQPGSCCINRWSGRSTWPTEASFVWIDRYVSTSYRTAGDYQPGVDRYMSVRFRTTASSPWRYGWVRVAIQAEVGSVTITVKDYAFEQTILSNKKPTADAWQVYPTPVENTLTLQSSTTGPKHATLLDAQGRVVSVTHFTAHTPELLDLTRLPAGVYVLRLTDDKGTVTKRINKL